MNPQPSTSISQTFINPSYSIPPPIPNPSIIQRNYLSKSNLPPQFGIPAQNFNHPSNFMPQIRPSNICESNICRLPTVHIRPQITPYSSLGHIQTSQIRRFPSITSEAVNWSLMVDAFVRKTTSGMLLFLKLLTYLETINNFKRSPSFSSRSRSYSASSYSSSSYSRSRSRSPQNNSNYRKSYKTRRSNQNSQKSSHSKKHNSRFKSKRNSPKVFFFFNFLILRFVA